MRPSVGAKGDEDMGRQDANDLLNVVLRATELLQGSIEGAFCAGGK